MANAIKIVVFATFLLHLILASYAAEGMNQVSSQVANGQAVESQGQAGSIAPAQEPASPRSIKGRNEMMKNKKDTEPGARIVFPVIRGKKYCVPKPNLSEQALKEQIDWGCNQGVDCDPIVNTIEISCSDQSWFVKAAYVMNYYFNAHGRDETSCNFTNHAMLTLENPSNATCAML